MTDISIKRINEITPFWVFYTKETGSRGSIQFSACANNFAIQRGSASDDGLKCVGLRYEKDGYGYYELFTAGHIRIKFSLKPGLLGGKKAAMKLRQQYESFEATLNAHGWRTTQESN